MITEFVDGFPALAEKASDGVDQIQEWLTTGPLHLNGGQLDATFDAASNWLNDNRGSLTNSAVDHGHRHRSSSSPLLLLVLFVTFFFMRDGRRIWRFLDRRPARRRPATRSAAPARPPGAPWSPTCARPSWSPSSTRSASACSWSSSASTSAFPLAALVFLAAFVPIVGATVSGAVAVLVALVDEGPISALIVAHRR